MLVASFAAGLLTVVAAALMAGLFYAYSISVVWGLDRADPRHAINVMNGINIAILNPWFLPVFVSVPVLAGIACGLFWATGQPLSAGFLGSAAAIYIVGVLAATASVNVPMNEALAKVRPHDLDNARQIWSSYSKRWNAWNHVRSIAALSAFCLATIGLVAA